MYKRMTVVCLQKTMFVNYKNKMDGILWWTDDSVLLGKAKLNIIWEVFLKRQVSNVFLKTSNRSMYKGFIL